MMQGSCWVNHKIITECAFSSTHRKGSSEVKTGRYSESHLKIPMCVLHQDQVYEQRVGSFLILV